MTGIGVTVAGAGALLVVVAPLAFYGWQNALHAGTLVAAQPGVVLLARSPALENGHRGPGPTAAADRGVQERLAATRPGNARGRPA